MKLSVNKVIQTGIIGLDLMQFEPTETFGVVDIRNFLVHEFLLKESVFKNALEQINWQQYTAVRTAVYCSSATILPQWAYMMIAAKLQPFTKSIIFGNKETYINQQWIHNIERADFSHFSNQKVTLRANIKVPEAAYIKATEKLLPLVTTLPYGEPGLPKVISKSLNVNNTCRK